MNRLLAACVFSALLIAPLCGCEDKINSEGFAAITPGMSLSEVEKILGGKGEMEQMGGYGTGVGGVPTSNQSSQTIYVWKNGPRQITVKCDKGKVLEVGKSGF